VQFLIEVVDSFGLTSVLCAHGRDLHGEDMVRVEARRDGLQSEKASNEKSCAREEDERKRELGDDQQATEAMTAERESAIGSGAAATAFERCDQVDVDGSPNGRESEEDADDERNREGETEDSLVQSDVFETRDIAWVDGVDDVNARLSDRKAG